MRTKNELYQEALRTVALRRQTARALAQDAQAQAEAAIPALRHAEEEVRVRGIRCALAGAAGKDRTERALGQREGEARADFDGVVRGDDDGFVAFQAGAEVVTGGKGRAARGKNRIFAELFDLNHGHEGFLLL